MTSEIAKFEKARKEVEKRSLPEVRFHPPAPQYQDFQNFPPRRGYDRGSSAGRTDTPPIH